MKKTLTSLLLLTSFVFVTQAQEMQSIPSSKELQLFTDGWYKFQLEGTFFDVEISSGKLVKGNIKWFDGSEYSGSLSDTMISGKGTYKWPDGSRYEGSFKNHQRHGKGSFIKADGTKWSGKWKANAKNGKGKVFDADGKVIQEGVWEANKFREDKK